MTGRISLITLAVLVHALLPVASAAPLGRTLHSAPGSISLEGIPLRIAGSLDSGPTGETLSLSLVFADGKRARLRYAVSGEASDLRISEARSTAPTSRQDLPPRWFLENSSSAPVDTIGGGLGIDPQGRLHYFTAGGKQQIVAEDLLPDSRIVEQERSEEEHRFVALSKPTERYPHGVVGDRLEAEAVTIVTVRPTAGVISEGSQPRENSAIARTIVLPTAGVIESVEAVVGEFAETEGREILLPVSTTAAGTRLVLLDHEGALIAEGPPIGRRFRWRHPLGGGALGPNGERELVAVRTPHIGGVLEYYQLESGQLKIVHSRGGYSTHRIGSRNLRTAAILRENDGGREAVVLPTQDHRNLALVLRTEDGSREIARRKLPGALTSNVLSLVTKEGHAIIVAGSRNPGDNPGAVTLWMPPANW